MILSLRLVTALRDADVDEVASAVREPAAETGAALPA
jgi:hypothetical protein